MKQRIISAIIALIICIPLIILGGNYFKFGISIISLIAYNEILNVRKKDMPLLVKILGLISILVYVLYDVNGNLIMNLQDVILISLLIFCVPLVFINKYEIIDAFYLFGFTLLVGLSFNFIINIRDYNIYLFTYLILITIMTDTFAYFSGFLFGKHKVCPKVSPNKTWEGCIGGLIFGTLISSFAYILLISNTSIFKAILMTILLSITCQIGDLIFSAIKRNFNVKDYGKLMPGHGGVLDRLDSLIWVVIVFNLISKFL